MGNTSSLCKNKFNYSESSSRFNQDSTVSTSSNRLSKPEVNKECFKILRVIGRGSFGKVFLVMKKDTGEIFAMKVLKKENVVNRN